MNPSLVAVGLAALVVQLGAAPAQEPGAPAVSPFAPVAQAPAALPESAGPLVPACAGDCGACCPQRRGGLLAGAGIYLLQPYSNNNMAFGFQNTANVSGTNPGTRFDSRVDIRHSMEVAPLVWLGYLGEGGLGGRVRWWYFREGTEQSATGTPASGGTANNSNGVLVFSAAPLGLNLITATDGGAMVTTSKLQLQVWDFDSLYRVAGYRWDLLFVGGLRLASLDQAYNAYANHQTLLSSSTFSGIGPTLGLEARRQLGGTGFNLYGSGRGSILFGSAHQIAAIPALSLVANEHHDIGLPVAEAELGLEYSRYVGASRFFGQIALVGQEWFGAGSASRSSTDVIPGGKASVSANFSTTSHVGDSDLAFFGLLLRAGVNY